MMSALKDGSESGDERQSKKQVSDLEK